MDLSSYYNELQTIYNWWIVLIFFSLFAVLFIGIRSIRDKEETAKEKAANCIMLTIIFASIIVRFFGGAYLCKKDVDQKTIYGYEGYFEIIELTDNILSHQAVFLIDGEEICLRYFEDDAYDFDAIRPGEYVGKIVYAKHAAEVLDIEIYDSE